ncbi:MAG: A24 family peptidase [Eubacteriales bacterium]|nr:A24 family peptidase [Eubacteriales bacterium]
MSLEHETAIRMLAAACISICALVDDCRRYRISNKLIITGLILQAFVMIITAANGRLWWTYICGGAVTFIIMAVIYMAGGIGAGDVKLMGVLGLLVGLRMGIYIVVVSLCIGAAVGILEIIFKTCRKTEVAVIGGVSADMHGFHYTIAIVIAQLILSLYQWGGVCVGT